MSSQDDFGTKIVDPHRLDDVVQDDEEEQVQSTTTLSGRDPLSDTASLSPSSPSKKKKKKKKRSSQASTEAGIPPLVTSADVEEKAAMVQHDPSSPAVGEIGQPSSTQPSSMSTVAPLEDQRRLEEHV